MFLHRIHCRKAGSTFATFELLCSFMKSSFVSFHITVMIEACIAFVISGLAACHTVVFVVTLG